MSKLEEMDFSKADRLTLKYHGRFAELGVMNFYEYSRAANSLARIAATLNIYKASRKVPERVTQKNNPTVFIRAPLRGSFPIELFSPEVATAVAAVGATIPAALAEVPLSVMFEHILKSMLGGTRSSDKLAEVLEHLSRRDDNDLEKERIRLALSQEETKRMELAVGKSGQIGLTAQQAKEVVEVLKAHPSLVPLHIATPQELRLVADHMEAEQELEARHRRYLQGLQIVDADMSMLRRKIRNQLQDLAVPLRNSADHITLHANDNPKSSFYLEPHDIWNLNQRELTAETFEARGNITAYDKLFGHGKCEIESISKGRISFSVSASSKARLLEPLSEALGLPTVTIQFKKYLNDDKLLTSIQVEDIIK